VLCEWRGTHLVGQVAPAIPLLIIHAQNAGGGNRLTKPTNPHPDLPQQRAGLCVNADTYEDSEEGAEPPGQQLLVGGAGAATPAGAEEEAAAHRPFDVSVLGRYDFRLRPTNFLPGYKTLRAPAILDYVR
jgi:hypothetical protein